MAGLPELGRDRGRQVQAVVEDEHEADALLAIEDLLGPGARGLRVPGANGRPSS